MSIILKRILRNPTLSILFALVILGDFIYFIIYAPNNFLSISNDPFRRIIITQLILFFVFMLLSYMLFYDNNQKGIHENRKIFWKSAALEDIFCFWVLIGCVLLTTIFAGIYFCSYYHRLSIRFTKEMIVYTIQFLVLYHVLPMVFAILVGRVTAFIENRLKGLTILFGIFYMFGFGFIGMMFDMFYKNYQGWHFTTLFCLMHFDQRCMFDLNYVASIESMQWYRIFFWIFLFGGFMLWGTVRKKPFSAVSFVLSIICFGLYFQPCGSMMAFKTSNGYDYIMEDYLYYNQNPNVRVFQNRNDFRIKSYNMTFTVSDILKADVSAALDNVNLKEYQFTLYHGYKINSITNENGVELPYTRDGDYLLVKNDGKELREIHFVYYGYSTNFYSTTQGMYLPANFEYYPHAGWTTVFDNEQGIYESDMPEYTSNFRIMLSVKGDYPIFTNVALSDGGRKGFHQYELEGNTDGLTLMGSPFLEENEIDGVRVISSRLNHHYYPEYQQNADKYREMFEKLDELGMSMEGKTFFEAPEHNWETFYLGQDSICDNVSKVIHDVQKFSEAKEVNRDVNGK